VPAACHSRPMPRMPSKSASGEALVAEQDGRRESRDGARQALDLGERGVDRLRVEAAAAREERVLVAERRSGAGSRARRRSSSARGRRSRWIRSRRIGGSAASVRAPSGRAALRSGRGESARNAARCPRRGRGRSCRRAAPPRPGSDVTCSPPSTRARRARGSGRRSRTRAAPT
jgi:hypothetical protein